MPLSNVSKVPGVQTVEFCVEQQMRSLGCDCHEHVPLLSVQETQPEAGDVDQREECVPRTCRALRPIPGTV